MIFADFSVNSQLISIKFHKQYYFLVMLQISYQNDVIPLIGLTCMCMIRMSSDSVIRPYISQSLHKINGRIAATDAGEIHIMFYYKGDAK